MSRITFSQREHARNAKFTTDCLMRTGRVYAEEDPANLEHSARVFAHVVAEDLVMQQMGRGRSTRLYAMAPWEERMEH